MKDTSTTSLLSFSLQPDRFNLVRLEGSSIAALASRELVQPFNLEWFQETGAAQKGFEDILKDLYRKGGGGIPAAGITLSADMALIKRVPMPLGLDELHIDSQVRWEADQALVSGRDEYILDYQKLPFLSQEGNPQYLLVLIRKKVVRELRNLFKRVGLTIADLDIDVFSLVRLMQRIHTLPPDDLSVIIDIKRGHFVVIFILKNEYYLSQKISFPAKAAGAAAGEDETASLIIKELKRLVFGHRLGTDISAVSRLFLAGTEEINQLVNELAGRSTVPVEILNPLSRFSAAGLHLADQPPSIYAAAVGMALKQNSAL